MLSAMVQSLVAVFEAHRYPACLKTLALAVEFFGKEADAAALLDYALTSSCNAAAPVYKVGRRCRTASASHTLFRPLSPSKKPLLFSEAGSPSGTDESCCNVRAYWYYPSHEGQRPRLKILAALLQEGELA